MENRAYASTEAYQSTVNSNLIESESYEHFDDIGNGFKKKVVQYELDFDRKQAAELIQSSGQPGYESRVDNFKSFTEMQLTTALGERFNRGLSKYSYRTESGALYGEHSEEPFLNVLERGVQYRKKHGNPIDHPREQAELDGFRKIESILGDDDTPVGTVMLTVSPPGEVGTIYKHNFYDVYQKNEEGNIDVVRYSNALNPDETLDKLRVLDSSINVPEELTSVSLLSNPIELRPDSVKNLTLEGIHKYLHKEHTVMSEEDFEKIRDMCAFLMVSYINSLIDDPYDRDLHARKYNALLNKADQIADVLSNDRSQLSSVSSSQYMTETEIYYLENQQVRSVDTGCGFSGGAELSGSNESALGPYSVASYGESKDKYGSIKFICPHCSYENIRPYNKLIERCGDGGQKGGCQKSVRC